MAYDRYDNRNERSRWSDEDDRFPNRGYGRDDRFDRERGRSGRDERGFFERAGDEIASWFGDDDADRRRDHDRRFEERGHGPRHEREHDRERFSDRDRGWDRERESRDEDRGPWSSRGYRNQRGGGFVSSRYRQADLGTAPGFERGSQPMFGGYTAAESLSDRDYRPMTGDYARSEEARRELSSNHDPHYHSWRRRQIDELDRDYDDYRRENQSRFESDFSNWRERRMQKRSLLGQIREHMEVVGNDDEHVGTIDRVAGDRIILAKSDPESGGAHHSLSCSEIDRVEGDRVILDCSANEARQRWRDESRSRALFEREDQGEMGPRILDRSFEGTYR